MNITSVQADRAQQKQVIAFLADSASYGPGCESVKRIDTHGAIIFLAGVNVYKIKRAVRYPYMDFSSLARRERVCRREFEINQLAAPSLYLDVVPITRESDGSLCIDGNGKPVEWAIHMRRFDQNALLANVVRTAELTSPLAKATAHQVLAYHRSTAIRRGDTAAMPVAGVVNGLCDFFLSRREHEIQECRVPDSLITGLCDKLRSEYERSTRLLNQRGQNGFVVRGHGDLHLSNIVVLDGRPLLFDALEFDESLATVDVLYDLAFLLMDLCVIGRRASANQIFNHYLFEDGSLSNLDGLRVLPLFLSLRAGIRAMVRLQAASVDDQAKLNSDLSVVADYLYFADQALSTGVVRLVAVGGFSGTGKSTLARALAPDIGAPPGALHIRSDLERKAQWKVSEATRLPESAYASSSTAAVYQAMLEKTEHSLRAGHSVVVDAVFSDLSQRRAFAELADRYAADFSGLWLQASPSVMRARILSRRDDASDATVSVLDKQLSHVSPPVDWEHIDAGGDLAQTLRLAAQALTSSG